MGAAFLPYRASVSAIFLRHCGRGETLILPCLKIVVGGEQGMSKVCEQGMFPVKYFCSTKTFLCQASVMEIIRLIQSEVKCGHPLLWDIADCKIVLSVCLSYNVK